jgi:ABC-type lipoprotein release transport system permease subunit
VRVALYLRLAWRNLWRNRKRTAITLFGLVLALVLMVAYSGLTWGLIRQMERNATFLGPGEVQIHRPGYMSDRSVYRVMKNPDAMVAEVEKRGGRAAPRVLGYGLVSHGENSSGSQLWGVDLDKEKGVTQFHRHILKGSFLERPGRVVVGKKIAVALEVDVGDEVVIVTQAADGSIGNDIYRVAGILKGISEEIDRSVVMMAREDFRNLFGLGDVAMEIVLSRGDKSESLEVFRDRIEALFPQEDVKTWREIFPTVWEMFQLAGVGIYILFAIMYLAASLILLNTMLMAVFERIRELGVMMALGFKPRQVVTLVLFETLLMTVVGCFLGLVVGIPMSLYFSGQGLDLSYIMGDGFSFVGIVADPHWYAVTNWSTVFPPVITLVAVCFLAVIYPAFKAARLKPVEALTFQ